jgi:hypothetical protein
MPYQLNEVLEKLALARQRDFLKREANKAGSLGMTSGEKKRGKPKPPAPVAARLVGGCRPEGFSCRATNSNCMQQI